MQKTIIIAEAGVNHNGSLNIAKQLVDVASMAGADYVKFQVTVPELLLTRKAPKAEYQKRNTRREESQFDMIRKLMLSFTEFQEINDYCSNKGCNFLATAFDKKSIDFLWQLEPPVWKIPSGEITNYPYLVAIAGFGKPIFMSTGMCTLKEVEQAIDILQRNGSGDITLLHCNTQYPTPYEDANLNAMLTLKRKFGVNVGYSDHTIGIEIPIAAVSMGATVIEKHFTLDKNMDGPDHKASLEPKEFREMVLAIRNVEKAMGNGEKIPTASEIANISIARKSIVASKAIKKGDFFSEDNITTKRPGTGLSPMRWNDILGTRATRNYSVDEMIEL